MNSQKLDDFLDNAGYPAVDLVVWQNHEPVYRHTNGFKDAEKTIPLTKDCLYKLFSASKVITNAAVLQLVESGKLGIDDEVSRYLPAFADMKVKDGDEIRPAKNAITIRLLQCMSAGMNYDFTPAMIELFKRPGGGASTKELVDAIAESPLDYEPGTHFKYSLAHDVLGAVIEVVTGERFGEYLKNHIYDPLGMTDTVFRLTPEQKARLTQHYNTKIEDGREIFEPIPADHPIIDSATNMESGGGGIFSTCDDYILFADALCHEGLAKNGFRLLKPETVRLMRQNQLDKARLEDFARLKKRGYGYGLGVRTMMNPEESGAKSPVGEFGWDGAAGAYTFMDPVNHLACFLGMQVMNNNRVYRDVHPRMRDLIYETLGL
jgi:CubicO group peptidase (beta-lactamase class C family)